MEEDHGERKSAPSLIKWMIEEEASVEKLEAEPILIKETALGCLKEQHKHKLLATFKALPQEDKAVMLVEMTGIGVEDIK